MLNRLPGRTGAALIVTLLGAFAASQSAPSTAAPAGADPHVVAAEPIPPLVKAEARALAALDGGASPTGGAVAPASPFPTAGRAAREPRRPPGTQLASVRSGESLPLRARPGGPVVGRVDSQTEFGSPTVLAAIEERGRWLGVSTPERPNGKLGWVRGPSPALKLRRTDYSITADLSRRRVELRRHDRVALRLPVAIGRPESPTPTGRFAITDKLDGPDYSPFFGCCILALSGNQPKLPPGWPGGDRLAIHATDSPESIGTAASAGCLRAGDEDMRKLMKRVPPGTPVRIKK